MRKELVKAIVIGTDNNSIVWSPRKSIFNNETTHHCCAKLDEDTGIEIEIGLDSDLNFNRIGILSVLNKDLPNGTLYIHSSDVGDRNTDLLKELGNKVYDKYIKPNIKFRSKTEDQILSGIIHTIPGVVVHNRDKKISEILDVSVDEVIEPVDIIAEKKKHWLWG